MVWPCVTKIFDNIPNDKITLEKYDFILQKLIYKVRAYAFTHQKFNHLFSLICNFFPVKWQRVYTFGLEIFE